MGASLSRPFAGKRRAELALLALALPFMALVGREVSVLSAQFGAAKVVWVALVGIGATVAMSSLRRGILVLVLALAFPFRTKLLFGVEVHTTHLLMLLVVAMGLFAMAMGPKRPPRTMLATTLLIAVGATIGALAGPDLGGSLFREANGVLLVLLVGIVAATFMEPHRDLPRLVLITAVALAGASLVALGQFSGRVPGSIAPTFEADRVNGLFLHPNILGGYLVANILLLVGSVSYAWQRIPLAAPVVLPSIGLGMAALFVTQSRGALFALVAGIVVVMALMAARRRAVAVLSILLVAGLALLAVVPRVPDSQRAAFAERIQKLNRPGAETGRKLVYTAAEDQIRKHPVTGVGTMTFRKIINSKSTVPGLESGLGHAHNIILEGWLSLGLLGMLAFFYLWGAASARLLRATRLRPGDDPLVAGWAVGALGALTSFFVQGMVDMVFWQIEMFVLLIVLIASGFAIDRERRERQALPPR
jgi:O-antigen ligase